MEVHHNLNEDNYDVKLKIVIAEEIYKCNECRLEALQQLMDLSATDDTTYFDSSTGFKNVLLPYAERLITHLKKEYDIQ